MEFMRATMDRLDTVTDLMRRVTVALTAQGSLQWDEQYPNRAFLISLLCCTLLMDYSTRSTV